MEDGGEGRFEAGLIIAPLKLVILVYMYNHSALADLRCWSVVYSAYTPALHGIHVTTICNQTHLMLSMFGLHKIHLHTIVYNI